ncbi:MAG: hypothetical protein PHU80_08760 [Kiritimatiellae bacterium]|nr:hypothetical protein [Kiritimatiellia bacterium]
MSFRIPICVFIFITLCLRTAATAVTDVTLRGFIWEQANAQAINAAKPEDFMAAAATYNRLVNDGVRNGLLFINLGNVLVMGGDGLNAAAAFSRAERYVGATPETKHGLSSALTLQTGRRQSDLPWSRTAFFWHYAFSCPVRAMAALAGWSVFWFGVLLLILLRRGSRNPMFRSLSETCLVAGGLLMLVFGASVIMTVAHERHDQLNWASRVFASTAHSFEEAAQ